MSIPKKGSRKIEVNGVTYIWSVKGLKGAKSLVVQQMDRGQLLVSYFTDWGFPYIEELAIKPAIVRLLILKALNTGWQPSKTGLQKFRCNLSEVELNHEF